MKKLIFSLFLLLVIPGAVASASFFSFFGDIFSKVSTQEKTINSQNYPLQVAAVAFSTFSDESSSDVSTVAGSAILPDVGPDGGLSDVDGAEGGHGQISLYVVHEDDSLSSIAQMFDVSVNTILWANSLPRGTRLTVGQTLVILPVSGVRHVVKRGDTVSSIAKKYAGDPDEIRLFNGIDGDTLAIDSEVIIPDGEVAVAAVKTKPASSKLRGGNAPVFDGYYQSPFGSYRKTQRIHGYNGVDIVSPLGVGAPVMAAAKGTVIIARQGSYNGGYGSYVVIQHGNGTQTLYGHLKSVTVSTGEIVVQGQMIGTMGNSGRSTGPHLHFEIRGAKNPF